LSLLPEFWIELWGYYEMFKIPRQSYTAEFEREAVKMVETGQRPAEVARQLGVSEQTLNNWRKAVAAGKFDCVRDFTPRRKSFWEITGDAANSHWDMSVRQNIKLVSFLSKNWLGIRKSGASSVIVLP
jgi:transposase